ncbi:hypothetical protein QR680_007264 [Steinernema hermaphroditum]|uniref:Uncharacterized protein n=1 Tax=Steinernema hermaphroditum TaxID=289476 RepID=A0AA39HY97_9BILA|nr:hypothetical protein QR680_007264 [Steinernema hermaphroditum]
MRVMWLQPSLFFTTSWTKEMERGEDVLELLDGHVNAGALESLPELGSRQASQQGRQIRQKFAQYFYSPSGQLSHRDYAQ